MNEEELIKKIESFNEWEKPYLRLFFSADIVGSTALKQKRGTDASNKPIYPAWFNTVLAFYHGAEQSFHNNWKEFKSLANGDSSYHHWFGEPPEIWKTVGDEVLFSKAIRHPTQAVLAIHVWIKTLSDIAEQLRDEHGLSVKSSAWLADFPVRNQEVILGLSKPAEDDEYPFANHSALGSYYANREVKAIREFIGPSIDTGFRLGAFSSPRKLVVSVELAYMLAVEQSKAEKGASGYSVGAMSLRNFSFRYEGKHLMKGVLGGSPYPVFWIDLAPEDPINRTEDAVLDVAKPRAHQVREFAEAMLEAYKPMIELPYIFSKDGEVPEEFCNVPLEHLQQLVGRRQRIEKTESKRETEEDMASQPMDQPSIEGAASSVPEDSSPATMDWSELLKALESFGRKKDD